MLAWARPERSLLAGATLALLGSGALALLFPVLVQRLVDRLTAGDPVDLAGWGLAVGLILGGQGLLAALRTGGFMLAGERIVRRLRERLFAALLARDQRDHDRSRPGELLQLLDADCEQVQDALSVDLSWTLRHLVTVLGGLAALTLMSPRLALCGAGVVVPLALASRVHGRTLKRWTRQLREALGAAAGVAAEVLGATSTVKRFHTERQEVARFAERLELAYAIGARRAGAVGLFAGLVGAARYAGVAVVVVYGAHLVALGELSLGTLTAFLIYAAAIAAALGQLVTQYALLMKAAGAGERLLEAFAVEPRIRSGWHAPEVVGELRIEGLRFAYDEAPVLRDVDLAVAPGETLALVGPSGSGKSTVADLLSRLYDAEGIRLDGVPLRDWDLATLRRSVAVVPQEVVLFEGTVAENIRYGCSASDEAVLEAARAAEVLSFADLDRPVGPGGVQLSGGQRQRIAVARALVRDPAILVLDEATSALDTESEALVQAALDRASAGRTTVVIAHRMSTIQAADRVAVLEGGRVTRVTTPDFFCARRAASR